MKLCRLCSRLGWPCHRNRRFLPKIVVKKLAKSSSIAPPDSAAEISSVVILPSSELGGAKPIRFVTFNFALFSMAPAVTTADKFFGDLHGGEQEPRRKVWERNSGRSKSMKDRPRSILKQSSLHPSAVTEDAPSRQLKFARSRLRVSINLPDKEISLKRSGQLSFEKFEELAGRRQRAASRGRAVAEVLRELNADVVALEEEKNMRVLSNLGRERERFGKREREDEEERNCSEMLGVGAERTLRLGLCYDMEIIMINRLDYVAFNCHME